MHGRLKTGPVWFSVFEPQSKTQAGKWWIDGPKK